MTGTPLQAAPPVRANLPEYTVSELSAALKRTIEQDFSYVRVRGEVSGFKRHGSGHCYLALKDAEAVLDAVCWRGTTIRLAVKPEDGMEVVCTGRLPTYPGRSKYQLVIESMELAGVGALLKLLEDRRKRLAAEGLFDEERKKRLPFLPRIIGVVTSPTGAVIRDILHRLNDRFPRHVLVWPVAVQGEAAASAIPLISAVGHETDTTLIDYASDRRAPTPTAAAEMAVPVRLDLIAELEAKAMRIVSGLSRFLSERRTRVEGLGRGLPDPRSLLDTARQRLDDRAERLELGLRQAIALRRHHLETAGGRLSKGLLEAQLVRGHDRLADALPRLEQALHRLVDHQQHRLENVGGRLEAFRQAVAKVLARGYAIVRDATGKIVESAHGIAAGDTLTLIFHDGKITVTAEDAAKQPRARPRKPSSPDQGSLL